MENQATVAAMSQGSQAISSIQRTVNVDVVDETMEQIAEQQEAAAEISDALGAPMGQGLDMDEDDLGLELDQMLAEDDAVGAELGAELGLEEEKPSAVASSSLPDVSTDAVLPSVPKDEPLGESKEEEEDLEALKALMA